MYSRSYQEVRNLWICERDELWRLRTLILNLKSPPVLYDRILLVYGSIKGYIIRHSILVDIVRLQVMVTY